MDNLQLLKTILSNEDIQNAINSGNFEDAYEKICENVLLTNDGDELIIPLFTEILYNAGIDPLKYLKYIPEYFATYSKKTSFDISNNVETIGNHAFSNCSNLKDINLSNNLISIGVSAFAHCKNLKSLTIPKSCNEIKNHCFLDCTNLKNIIIESPNVKIGINCFSMCSNIENVTYIGTFKDFGNMLFSFPTTLAIVFHCSDGNYAYDDHYHLRKIK